MSGFKKTSVNIDLDVSNDITKIANENNLDRTQVINFFLKQCVEDYKKDKLKFVRREPIILVES